jgi:PAS domain S-box-containing protein
MVLTLLGAAYCWGRLHAANRLPNSTHERLPLVAGLALALTFGGVASTLLRKEITRRKRARQALLEANEELARRVAERNDAFDTLKRGLEGEVAERRRKDAEVKAAEARYRLLFADNPHPMWVSDLETHRFLEVNDAAVRLYGYSREEFLTMSVNQLRSPGEPSTPLETETDPSGAAAPRVQSHRRKDGTRIEVELLAHALDYQGRRAEWRLALDVTERRRAEDALRLSEQRFRALVEASPMGLHLYRLEADDRLVFVGANLAADCILGVNNQQFVGKTLEEAFPALVRTEVPERYRLAASAGGSWHTEQITYADERVGGAFEVFAFQVGPGLMAAMFADITARKQAEETLKQEREMAQRYLHLAGVILVALRPDQTVSLINRKGCEVLGRDKSEILDRNWFDTFLPKRLRATVKEVFNKLIAGQIEITEYYENPILGLHGEERIIAWHNTLLRDERGAIIGTLSSGEDITEKRRLETQRDRLFNLSLDMLCVGRFDGFFAQVNPAWMRTLGWTEAELCRQPFTDFVHPDDVEATKQVRARLAAGQAARDFENRFRCRDGTYRWLSWNVFPLPQEERFFAVARDVTQGKQAAQALRESEAKLTKIFSATPELIAVVSVQDGRFLEISESWTRLLDRPRESIVGHTVVELGLWPTTSERRRVMNMLQSQGEVREVEVHFRRPSGETFAGLLSMSPLQFGDSACAVAVVTDITARKRAEDELRELAGRLLRVQDEERRRIGRELHDSTSQTLAALEINLGLLRSHASTLNVSTLQTVEECRDLAEQASNQIRTLSYLLHPPLLDEVGLASALQWYVDGFTRRSGIPVDLVVPLELGRLPKETELSVFRIVQECLANVHRHSGSGRASVLIARSPGEVVLEVADQGHGLPEATLAALHTGGAPLGVGLTGMRERVRQLNGRLEIDSSAQGAKVTVLLPLPPDAP